MQNKNLLISFLQAFGILLVVAGHSDHGAPETPLWHTWIYSFHMPLFMFISGFLLRYGIERKGVSLASTPLGGKHGFVWKKVKRLLVPYVVISTLAFLPKAMLNRFAMRPVDISPDFYVHQLLYPWDNVIKFFWFLPTLFIIFLLAVCGARLFRNYRGGLFHVSILVILFLLHVFNPLSNILLLNLGGVVNYLFYFALGYMACCYRLTERMDNYLSINIAWTFLLSVSFVTFIPDFMGRDILAACNGIMLSLFLGKAYVRHKCRFLNHLFGASYAIYLFSWFPQTASQQVFLSITHAPWQIGSLLAFVTGTYLPWLIYQWIIRYKTSKAGRCIAFLIGH